MHASEDMIRGMESLVKGGKGVVTADSSTMISIMLDALRNGRIATFYVSPEQAQAVMRLHWTPGRVREVGMERVSQEEREKIESELGVKDMGTGFSNRIQCSCGGVYGAFEFIEQGLREHGREWVGAVVELKETAVLRINPTQDAFCPKCGLIIIVNHNYSMYSDSGKLIYGCCRSETIGGGTVLA
jgi:hypothetical protein